MNLLEDFCNERTSYTIIQYDPVINRAIYFALGDGLIAQQVNGFYKLTKKGKEYSNLIWNDSTIMIKEKKYLSDIIILTEQKIKGLENVWGFSDATN
jgi:hypothetical protein